jgi:hypothetical protein
MLLILEEEEEVVLMISSSSDGLSSCDWLIPLFRRILTEGSGPAAMITLFLHIRMRIKN